MRSPKSYSMVKCLFAASELLVTDGILSEFGPFCRHLWCIALYFGIVSNLDYSVIQRLHGLRNPSRHPAVFLVRHQVYGGALQKVNITLS